MSTSTYSTNLKIELMTPGEQSNTWGNVTNTNLGTLIEQAISGYVTQSVSTGTDTTITIPNGSTGVARNMYIELTGSGGTNTNLIVPANKKLYFIYNNTSSGQVTVKVSGQTGVSVANGKKVILVCDGTDVELATSYPTTPVAVTDGGTGVTTSTGTGNVVLSTSPTLTTPNLGTPSAATLTNATGLPLTTGVTGTLPVANGGTGVTGSTGSGNVVLSTSPTLTTPNLGTPSAATLTNATGLPLSTGITGTLPVANGGTGQTSYTNGQLLIGNTTGNTLTKAALTAGTGISITNGAGSITIASTVSTGDITFSSATISSSVTDQNLNIVPNGGGELNINTTSPVANGYCVNIATGSGKVYGAIVKTTDAAREDLALWNSDTSGNNIFVGFGTEASYTPRGTISYNRAAGQVAYNTTSDRRAKIIEGPVTNSGQIVDALQVYTGRMMWADINMPMMIADEAMQVTPYCVTGEPNAVDEKGNPIYQQMDYSALVPLLLAEIQSLRSRVAAIEGS